MLTVSFGIAISQQDAVRVTLAIPDHDYHVGAQIDLVSPLFRQPVHVGLASEFLNVPHIGLPVWWPHTLYINPYSCVSQPPWDEADSVYGLVTKVLPRLFLEDNNYWYHFKYRPIKTLHATVWFRGVGDCYLMVDSVVLQQLQALVDTVFAAPIQFDSINCITTDWHHGLYLRLEQVLKFGNDLICGFELEMLKAYQSTSAIRADSIHELVPILSAPCVFRLPMTKYMHSIDLTSILSSKETSFRCIATSLCSAHWQNFPALLI